MHLSLQENGKGGRGKPKQLADLNAWTNTDTQAAGQAKLGKLGRPGGRPRPILVMQNWAGLVVIAGCRQRLAARASALGAAGTPGSTLLAHPNRPTAANILT